MDFSTFLQPEMVEKLQAGGYFLMFGIMILEGPLVTVAAAFLASLGFFDIYIVALLGWLGDMLGDMIFFMIGRYGLRIFQKKTTIDTPSEKTFIDHLDHLIHSNLIFSLFIIKFTPYAPPIGLTYIGRSNVGFFHYLRSSFITSLPIPLAAAFIGFHIGYIQTLLQKYTWTEILPYIISGVFVVILIGLAWYYFRAKTQSVIGKNVRIIRHNTKKK